MVEQIVPLDEEAIEHWANAVQNRKLWQETKGRNRPLTLSLLRGCIILPQPIELRAGRDVVCDHVLVIHDADGREDLVPGSRTQIIRRLQSESFNVGAPG